jgi:hypothetical protein
MKKYIIVNIHWNAHYKNFYAEVHDVTPDGSVTNYDELITSATLDYCVNRVKNLMWDEFSLKATLVSKMDPNCK